MSDFNDDYDYLHTDEPRDIGPAERGAIAFLGRLFPSAPRCDIPLDGPSAMHSKMAENGDLDEHVTTRHRSDVPGVKTMLFLLEEAEEGGYVASVATRPGCISQGETVPEALENLADAWRELDAHDAHDAQPK